MKKSIFILLFSFACSLSCLAQANFSFEKSDHDFGAVEGGKKDTIWYDFKFTNTGSEPLVISDVRTSCDCTLAEWPKDAIQPGKSGVIKGGFKYDETKSGTFEKSIIIFANTSPATTFLNITGKINLKQ